MDVPKIVFQDRILQGTEEKILEVSHAADDRTVDIVFSRQILAEPPVSRFLLFSCRRW